VNGNLNKFFISGLALPMTVYTWLTLPIIMYMSTNMDVQVYINTAIIISRLQNIWLLCNVASLRQLLSAGQS